MENKDVNISEFLGKTFSDIEKSEDEIIFKTNDGLSFKMYHAQDCCEDVRVEDIEGDLSDLLGSPIVQAEESVNPDNSPYSSADSYTWTFYKLATIKGYVTIRWYGESNGHYSESVDIVMNKFCS